MGLDLSRLGAIVEVGTRRVFAQVGNLEAFCRNRASLILESTEASILKFGCLINLLLDRVQILGIVSRSWRGLAIFLNIESPLLSKTATIPHVAVDQVLVMILRWDLSFFHSIFFFGEISTWALLNWKDRDLFSDGLESRIVKWHAWWVMTFKVDFILGKVRLLCLRSHGVSRTCTFGWIQLVRRSSIGCTIGETRQVVVTWACNVYIRRNESLHWLSTDGMVELPCLRRHRERAMVPMLGPAIDRWHWALPQSWLEHCRAGSLVIDMFAHANCFGIKVRLCCTHGWSIPISILFCWHMPRRDYRVLPLARDRLCPTVMPWLLLRF